MGLRILAEEVSGFLIGPFTHPVIKSCPVSHLRPIRAATGFRCAMACTTEYCTQRPSASALLLLQQSRPLKSNNKQCDPAGIGSCSSGCNFMIPTNSVVANWPTSLIACIRLQRSVTSGEGVATKRFPRSIAGLPKPGGGLTSPRRVPLRRPGQVCQLRGLASTGVSTAVLA